MAISRVIEVSFRGSSVALVRIDTAYFYNNGIIFKPTDIDLPASYQVHWADSPQASSTLETIGTAEGAPIPDDLWNRSRVIYGWIYLHPTEDSGVTGYEVRIYKNVRAGLPDGTEPTPAEQSTIDQLIGALNSAVEQTGEDVESASQSAQSAERAKTAAENARDTAGEYANDAESSAASASNKASEASTSAQTASTKATEASQSATNASQLAQTAEQAKTASQTAQGLAESARDAAVSAKTDAESARDDAETARDEAQSAVASISGALDDKAPVITDTASGAIASFSDGADNLPLKSLIVDINPIQDLHGQESPYPAGGGKNLAQLEQGSLDFAIDGSEIPSSSRMRTNFIPIELATDYISSAESNGWVIKNGCGYDANKNYLGYGTYPASGTGKINLNKFTFPWISQVKYVRFIYGNQNNTACTPSDYWYQFEKGSTATAYAPYENLCPISGWTGVNVNHSDADMTNPTTLTIQLGQTVYGGKLDVISGELTVYPYYASYNGETLTGEWISDRDKYVAGTTPTIGAQVVNIGAQGVTVQLEPHEVESLYGVNNLWADSGDTEVEYRADTKLFIERLTAPDSADMVADANITSGQYFMVGNTLYKATANIANGSAIIVGTNAVRKSLSEALNEINA